MEHYNLRSFENYMNKKFGFGVSNMASLKNTDMFGDMSNTKLSYFKMSDVFNNNKTKTILPWVAKSQTFLDYYKTTPIEKLYNYKESESNIGKNRHGWFIKWNIRRNRQKKFNLSKKKYLKKVKSQ